MRRSLAEATQAALVAVEEHREEAPLSEFKAAFLRKGAYLTATLIVLQFIGIWVAALLDKPSPTNSTLLWALIFVPVLLPSAFAFPEGLQTFGTFLTTLIPRLRGKDSTSSE